MKQNQNPNIDPKVLNGLLKMAAGKLGTTPEKLERQLKDGSFENELSGMPKDQANNLKQALSNPETCKKILSTPQAKAIYEKLNRK